jgi:hypothetical protein
MMLLLLLLLMMMIMFLTVVLRMRYCVGHLTMMMKGYISSTFGICRVFCTSGLYCPGFLRPFH